MEKKVKVVVDNTVGMKACLDGMLRKDKGTPGPNCAK